MWLIIPSMLSVAGMNLWPNTYKTKVPLWDAQLRVLYSARMRLPGGILFVSFSALPIQIKMYSVVISNSNPTNVYSPFIIFSKMYPYFPKIFKMTVRVSSTVSIKQISRRKQLGNMLELQRRVLFRQTFFFLITKHRQTQCFEKQTEMLEGLSPGNSTSTWRILLRQGVCFALLKLTLR